MKLLFVICEASVDQRVMEYLEREGVGGYTRFTGCIGVGKNGRRDGTPVWPGLNTVLMVLVPTESASSVLAALERIKEERGGRLGLKVIAVDAEAIA